ncbi:PIN domain-containing protein [Svornostia abyssi]|uniref:Ribonuclease VapC n=1 Tax=Svornostia abyssi TaxID=2898438 RepID=A0ABY5PJG7_9ACTN|nr:PIN domain-containing protein [Parviterribacteraceae bacterium J379]
MAADRAFVDTNVLVYAHDVSEPEKQQRAAALLASRVNDLVISAQVLGEFFNAVTRRLPTPLSTADAAAAVAGLSLLPVVPVDAQLVRAGIEIHEAHQVSYWDGLILAAARSARCGTLLTEDLHTGATLAGVTVENPFV